MSGLVLTIPGGGSGVKGSGGTPGPHAATHEPGGSDAVTMPLGGVPVQDVVIGDYLSLTGNTLDVANAGQTSFIVQNLSAARIAAARKGRVAEDYLPQAQELSALPTGYMKSEEGTGVVSTLTKIPAADIEGGAAGGPHAASHQPSGTDQITRLRLTSTVAAPTCLEVRSDVDPPDAREWRVRSEQSELRIWAANDAGVLISASLRLGRNADLYSGTIVADHHFFTGGYLQASGGLSATPLNASQLTSGIVPDARLTPKALKNTRASDFFGTDQIAWALPAPGNAYFVTVNATAACGLHGIVAQADGYSFVLTNSSTSNLTVMNDSASAVAANRIICPGSVSIALSRYASVTLMYDGGLSRWRVVGKAL